MLASDRRALLAAVAGISIGLVLVATALSLRRTARKFLTPRSSPFMRPGLEKMHALQKMTSAKDAIDTISFHFVLLS